MWKCQQFEFKQKLVHNWNRDQWISWLTLCRFPWPNIFIMIIKTTFKAEGKQNVKNWLPFVIWCWKQNWWFLVPFFIYIFTFAKRSKQNLSNSFLFCFSFSSLHHSKQRKKKKYYLNKSIKIKSVNMNSFVDLMESDTEKHCFSLDITSRFSFLEFSCLTRHEIWLFVIFAN